MSQYLKHFTAVGDEQHSTTHWLDEEEHDEALEEVSVQLPQHQDPHNFQEAFRRLFIHDKFQIFVVCLVILDAVFVLCELLMDLSIIKADEKHIAPKVFHYLSLALLTFFMVELVGKIFAYHLEFFKHKFEVLDGVVVIVSFVLDIVYISHEDAFNAMGLIILLRLWRVARIINGVLVSVKNRSDHRMKKLKETNKCLVIQINEQKQHHCRIALFRYECPVIEPVTFSITPRKNFLFSSSMVYPILATTVRPGQRHYSLHTISGEQENIRLHNLLQQHGINF